MDSERYQQSKEQLSQKLDALHEALTEKINEYGAQIRNTPSLNREDITGHLNKLKVDQFKVKEYLVKIDGTNAPNWENFRTDAEKMTSEIEDNLKNNIPTTI